MTPPPTPRAPLEVRRARPDELPAVGELTVATYVGDGFVPPADEYVATLRDAAARAADGDVFVAVDGAGSVVGAVAVFTASGGPRWFENARPDDAVLRMLAVAPSARGSGAGARLTAACVGRARELGCTRVRLSTMPQMHAAHRLYERLGFTRVPAEDWEPLSGMRLLAFALPLMAFCERCGRAGDHPGCERTAALEPPRWCGACGRRMVVQVLPTGWWATCSRHGAVSSRAAAAARAGAVPRR